MINLANSYKKSRYNCFLKGNDGAFILYNSLRGSLYKVKRSDFLQIEKHLTVSPADEMQNGIAEFLVQNGYSIPSDCDETLFLRKMINDNLNRPILELCILPTQQCNFRCSYCFETVADAPQGIMTDAVADAGDCIVKPVCMNAGCPVLFIKKQGTDVRCRWKHPEKEPWKALLLLADQLGLVQAWEELS